MSQLDSKFWKNKKVLITGHTGFKGSWLTVWLHSLGADVFGYALAPVHNINAYRILNLDNKISSNIGDIRDYISFETIVTQINPDIIFHLAAQPLVSVGYSNPLETFETNIMGTVNLLEISRQRQCRVPTLIISSDKCYLNNNTGIPLKIDDPLGGSDPYSASKAGTEIVVSAYQSYNISRSQSLLASARAGNVIGGGDWSENRLLPDAARAFASGNNLKIRNPSHTRPWQHVLEPLYGYMILMQHMFHSAGFDKAWNFGPNTASNQNVQWVAETFKSCWGTEREIEYSSVSNFGKEASLLSLDCSKTSNDLNIRSVLELSEAIEWTVDWYKLAYALPPGTDMYKFTVQQISKYIDKIND